MGKYSPVRAFMLFCSVVLSATVWADYTNTSSENALLAGGASGGDEVRVIQNGDGTVDFVHLFTKVGAGALNVPHGHSIVPRSLRLLVVGGGGAGGGDCGGGGGAGGFLLKENLFVDGNLSIVVGQGGTCAAHNSQGGDGGVSKITFENNGNSYTAHGGGGGGRWNNSAQQPGNAGGSGGGGSCGGTGGASKDSQGNAGGNGGANDVGGGGGGAGGAGASASDGVPGAGGLGKECDISGNVVVYAAGGGGAGSDQTKTLEPGGLGGSGVGGDGAYSQKDGSIVWDSATGEPGDPNTGSGGGGGRGMVSSALGGNGGSGIVIVRYTVPAPDMMVNGADVSRVNGQEVIKFTNPAQEGAFMLNRAARVRYLVVGGGGAGANPGAAGVDQPGAGGGGAGGLLAGSTVFATGNYTIHVGAGGATTTTPQSASHGADGEDSTVRLGATTTLQAVGGGGGHYNGFGRDGGSGGGGALGSGGAGISGQGHPGGFGGVYQAGGGGGGAGGAGGDTRTLAGVAGEGGVGLANDITGASVTYATGGAGGTRTVVDGVTGRAGTNGLGNGGTGGGLLTAGGAGGSGVVIFRIEEYMPERPGATYSCIYNGAEHVVYEGSAGCRIYNAEGDRVDNIVVKDVGEHTFRVYLNKDQGYPMWADGSSDSQPVEVTVVVEALTITSFSIEGWQEGEAPNPPVLVSTPQLYYPGGFLVQYRPKGSKDEAAWTFNAPTAVGDYEAKLDFSQSGYANEPDKLPNDVADLRAYFSIWSRAELTHDIPSLGYFATVSLTGEAPDEATDRWVEVKLAENQPLGFHYRHAQADGSDLRFLDAQGNLLGSFVATWDTTGESSVFVQLPAYTGGQTLTLFWGELVDQNPPNNPYRAQAGPAADRLLSGVTVAVGVTHVRPNATFKNRWIVEPTIEFTEWFVGETPPAMTLGEAAYGTAYNLAQSGTGAVLTNTVPTAVGGYTLVGFAAAGRDAGGTRAWAKLYTQIATLFIQTQNPYDDLTGVSTNITAAGRVFLANDFADAAHPVIDQSYYLTDAAQSQGGSYWRHGNESQVPLRPYIQWGTTHDLLHVQPIADLCDAKTIWHLEDVRIGNTYGSSLEPSANRNYLPYSDWAKAISSASGPTGAKKESAHLLLRNSLSAAIYSPCYTNGIGTIYFDAVNEMVSADGAGYGIILEMATVATNEVGEVVFPSDENCLQVIQNYEVNDAGDLVALPPVTNLYGSAIWTPVKLQPLAVNDASLTAEPETEALSLKMNQGGSMDHFYRVCAKVDVRGPVRFRLRRATTVEDSGLDSNFILVDNLIVSYPAMRVDLAPHGFLDETKGGKQALGQELAFDVPFPSVNDTFKGRAQATYYTNVGFPTAETNTFVTAATLWYRWRYLNQRVDDWQSVILNTTEDFNSVDTFKLPGLAGDLEFFYELRLNAPYYNYFDYSGADLQLGGLYSENIGVVTNRLNAANLTEACGNDWFVRLRDGQSDFEAVNLVIRTGLATNEVAEVVTNYVYGAETVTTNLTTVVSDVTYSVPMEIVDNHMWRAYLKTLPANAGTVDYRFELLNRQTAGATTFETNKVIRASDTTQKLPPINAVVQTGDESSWTPLTIDAATGYILFQMDDTHNGLTVVRADYQNFNAWSDAKHSYFVGTSTEDGKVGTAGTKKEYTADFKAYQLMPEADPDWNVPNTTWLGTGDMDGRVAYQPFTSDNSGAWQLGQAMWVSKWYADDTDGVGVAAQLAGQGRGYLQIVDKDYLPRGIKEINFNARLGQFINFSDFAYYDGGDKTTMTNYTFITRAAFDENGNQDFTGNASLSMVAYYRPGVGCYEFRVEQVRSNYSAASKKVTGVDQAGQRFSLYRWSYDNTGKMTAKLLKSHMNRTDFGSFAYPTGHVPFFFSVSNSVEGTCLMVGVGKANMRAEGSASTFNDRQYAMMCYRDSDVKRLKNGSYGLLTANCPGIFVHPQYLSAPLPLPDTMANRNEDKASNYTISTFKTDSDSVHSCEADIEAGNWVLTPGRMQAKEGPSWGLKAVIIPQTLTLYTAEAGQTAWTPAHTYTVTDFKSRAMPPLKLYSPEKKSIRLAVDGTDDDVRRDVVIDSLEMTQWAGEDWDNYEDAGKYAVGTKWQSSTSDWGLSNFVWTTGWTQNGGLLMSAKRALPNDPVSIRSPLMDGYSYYNGAARGIGLGMMSFSFKNADSRANLLLQIATNNVTAASLGSLNNFDAQTWTTVTNFTFSAGESGVRSAYLGLHGVKGVMRLVMDRSVVQAAQASDDPNYGAITITKIFCRDEPNLDLTSWWGWNLRTVGPNGFNADIEKRMYLPDLSSVDAVETGLSLALNNSITADIVKEDADLYKEHIPFVQTPTFATNVIGSVSFKARVYDSDTSVAYVGLYGAAAGDSAEADWTFITNIVVDTAFYKTYSYTTPQGTDYAALRLGVTGVEGVLNPGSRPIGGAVRVLLDEVVISEAIRARMSFRNVGAFRSFMSGTDWVPNVPSAAEQPLCNEGWGVQCEIFAAQLADEIDQSKKPEVTLHWFEGSFPWGFEKWRDDPEAKKAELTPVANTNGLYRSTYASLDNNVIPMSTYPGTVVQYMLEVRYWQKDSAAAVTNYLVAGEWENPSWYAPLDKNAGESHFSAYTILDSVAPGWAWINEVNLYGTHDENYLGTEDNCQFIEIAVPQEADIADWYVRLLGPNTSDGSITTNIVGTFGTDVLPGRQTISHPASNMVFRVLGSYLSHKGMNATGKLDPSLGEIDNYWTFATDGIDGTIFAEDYSIDWAEPIGIQLVRGSGVVEHEMLCVGTNWYGNAGFGQLYTPERCAALLNEKMPGSNFEYMGEDNGGYPNNGASPDPDNSLSVVTGRGKVVANWNPYVVRTPGQINEGQEIEGEPPTPSGETIILYANVDNQVGHIVQTVGDGEETNASQIIFLKRGSAVGTNIVYKTSPWWTLNTVLTNGVDIAAQAVENGLRTWTINVGAGVSNNLTVVASARVRDDLTGYGLTEDNRYTPAILDWLEKGVNAYGEPFAKDDETIRLAEFVPLHGTTGREMSLTQMYWLDMDPTVGNLALKGGMSKAPATTIKEGYWGTDSLTNVQMGVTLYITNRTEDANSPYYGTAWTPYTLRGLQPGELSADPNRSGNWTSATFKVTGILANGLTSESNPHNWVPLRWFAFNQDSFSQDAANFGETLIEVSDPYSTESPGYSVGWYDWVQENGYAPVFFSWNLNEAITPFGVEILKKVNYYD